MSDKEQFDVTMGGTCSLPSDINLMKFAAIRVKEIHFMNAILESSSGSKLTFQRLPKHMRRRVMSHNIKRLPRRLREIHFNQLLKSGLPSKQKNPSRRYKRKPRNLAVCRDQRQNTIKWLETHIWHAKRFHMVQKWGYRLPNRPSDKAYRACYRATAKHCLIQDISYFNCIELIGPATDLINGFKTLINPSINLSIGAKAYIQGKREGEFVLFHSNGSQPVGTILFNWKPETEEHKKRVLWLWIHAAYYFEALDVITECFKLTKLVKDDKTYINSEKDLELIELDKELNRFRLTGPLSFSVLYNALKLGLNTDSVWFKKYLNDANNIEIFSDQCKYWTNLENSTNISPNLIISLVVSDPRLSLPKTKTKAPYMQTSFRSLEIPKNIAMGPLWDGNIRKTVKYSKLSNSKILEVKNVSLVPGTNLENAVGDAIPVAVIYKPGNRKNLDFSSGWDIIIPSGWGNTFWISLIMRGAKAGGLREFDSTRFENGQLPILLPDTTSGKENDKALTEAYTDKFFALPPNKRINYVKFGILQPFSYNWKTLIREWKTTSEPVRNFCVLREKKKLHLIEALLENKSIETDFDTFDLDEHYIIPVSIKMEKKGSPMQFTRIYLLDAVDLIENVPPIEPLKEDEFEKHRKNMRDIHKSLLKKLKRKRAKAKLENKECEEDNSFIEQYNAQMKRLWLPAITKGIRKSCSRQIMGFVTLGGFSYTQAHSVAVGYIVLGALRSLLLQEPHNRVLVRNISGCQYRFAHLSVSI